MKRAELKDYDASRHNAALIALHWVMAALILGNYLGGRFVLAPEPNGSGVGQLLAIHVIAGLAILSLFLPRLLVRVFTKRPPGTGSAFEKALSGFVHWGFYVVMFATISTGLGLAGTSGTIEAIFTGAPLPTSFSAYPPARGHALFANVLVGLVVLHVLAALYHHFVKRDGVLGRMWFGRPRFVRKGA